jgi:hypothetical protein
MATAGTRKANTRSDAAIIFIGRENSKKTKRRQSCFSQAPPRARRFTTSLEYPAQFNSFVVEFVRANMVTKNLEAENLTA